MFLLPTKIIPAADPGHSVSFSVHPVPSSVVHFPSLVVYISLMSVQTEVSSLEVPCTAHTCCDISDIPPLLVFQVSCLFFEDPAKKLSVPFNKNHWKSQTENKARSVVLLVSLFYPTAYN